MSYKVKTIPKFDKELKRLVKKYPSLKEEFIELASGLKENPTQGTPLGNHCFKIRISVSSKGAGKSGGARVITYIQVSQTSVFLLSIYDKSEEDSISDKELTDLLKWIPE
jgi:mRNA-degrading endonuclease RelE of RelBE toxin-antitoxin system